MDTDSHELQSLADIALESSFVLDIQVRPGVVRFFVDFVLTPEHPNYGPPTPGEQFCFRRGQLSFLGVERLIWLEQGLPPAIDANNERDYGNFDSLAFDGVRYEVEGGWGRMEIRADSVEVLLDN